VLFLGTSLTAGMGVGPEQAFPARIQERIEAAGLDYHVVNAGLSGETSAGALRRLDWVLLRDPAVVVLETGANDGLRGQDPDAIRRSIQGIIDRVRRHSPAPQIVLVGMRAVTNYGESYTERFREIYPELAAANDLPLVGFLLEGVAGRPELNQADGIHPTAEGQRRMADNVWPVLEPILRQLSTPENAQPQGSADSESQPPPP
jgi:acyl-CoA thioesterase-1